MESIQQDMINSINLTSSNEDTAESDLLASELFNIIQDVGLSDQFINNNSTNTDPLFDILNNLQEEDKYAGSGKPYVKIVEEPARDLYRFRYRSEGGTAGTIPGEKQQNGGKSFPKIMVCDHDGLAALEVCCLTEDLKVHPNKLVRKF